MESTVNMRALHNQQEQSQLTDVLIPAMAQAVKPLLATKEYSSALPTQDLFYTTTSNVEQLLFGLFDVQEGPRSTEHNRHTILHLVNQSFLEILHPLWDKIMLLKEIDGDRTMESLLLEQVR